MRSFRETLNVMDLRSGHVEGTVILNGVDPDWIISRVLDFTGWTGYDKSLLTLLKVH